MALAGLTVALAVWVSSWPPFLDFERQHLPETHLDPGACPYVAAMHEAANQFQSAMPFGSTGYDANGNPLTWPETQMRLSQAAGLLEDSITASLEQFPPSTNPRWNAPPPVQPYLTIARNNLHDGREQIALAQDGYDLTARTSAFLRDGRRAFGYAGDLIGHQCSEPLGADGDTIRYPCFLTTTTVGSIPCVTTFR